MIGLRFDTKRHGYIDTLGSRIIPLRYVHFFDGQERVDRNFSLDQRSQLEVLAESAERIARDRFAKERVKPNAYAVKDMGPFYAIDYLSAPEKSFVSLAVKAEEAAK